MIPPQARQELQSRLSQARRIAVLAVGSTLRADDAAGIVTAEELAQLLEPPDTAFGEVSPTAQLGPAAAGKAPPEVFIFFGHTAPENLTGEIKRFDPSHLLIIDAADLGQSAGTVALIEPDRIGASMSASTHVLPLNVLTRYLQTFLKCEVVIIGIQPKSRDFNQEVSPEVHTASKAVAEMIMQIVKGGSQ